MVWPLLSSFVVLLAAGSQARIVEIFVADSYWAMRSYRWSFRGGKLIWSMVLSSCSFSRFACIGLPSRLLSRTTAVTCRAEFCARHVATCQALCTKSRIESEAGLLDHVPALTATEHPHHTHENHQGLCLRCLPYLWHTSPQLDAARSTTRPPTPSRELVALSVRTLVCP